LSEPSHQERNVISETRPRINFLEEFFRGCVRGICLYFVLQTLTFGILAVFTENALQGSPPSITLIVLGVLLAPWYENLICALITIAITYTTNNSRRSSGKENRANFGFFLSRVIVYLVAMETHGLPFGPITGITFLFYQREMFSGPDYTFSPQGFIRSVAMHSIWNVLTFTIGIQYFTFIRNVILLN
jgi:hypothetical protein